MATVSDELHGDLVSQLHGLNQGYPLFNDTK